MTCGGSGFVTMRLHKGEYSMTLAYLQTVKDSGPHPVTKLGTLHLRFFELWNNELWANQKDRINLASGDATLGKIIKRPGSSEMRLRSFRVVPETTKEYVGGDEITINGYGSLPREFILHDIRYGDIE